MKHTLRCSGCGGTSLWYIERVAANEETGTGQEQPTFQLSVYGYGPQGRVGDVEAWACRTCLRIEFFLKQPLRADGKYIREVGGPPPGSLPR